MQSFDVFFIIMLRQWTSCWTNSRVSGDLRRHAHVTVMGRSQRLNLWSGPAPSPLQWRHNGCDCVSNQQPHDCLLNRLFRRRSKKTSKLRVTGLCAGNSPETGEFPAQMASTAENVSIWWRHHVNIKTVSWGMGFPYKDRAVERPSCPRNNGIAMLVRHI